MTWSEWYNRYVKGKKAAKTVEKKIKGESADKNNINLIKKFWEIKKI